MAVKEVVPRFIIPLDPPEIFAKVILPAEIPDTSRVPFTVTGEVKDRVPFKVKKRVPEEIMVAPA